MGERNENGPEGKDWESTIEGRVEELFALQTGGGEEYEMALLNLSAGLPGMGDNVSENNIKIKTELYDYLKEYPAAKSNEQEEMRKQIFELASRYEEEESRSTPRNIEILREFFKPAN